MIFESISDSRWCPQQGMTLTCFCNEKDFIIDEFYEVDVKRLKYIFFKPCSKRKNKRARLLSKEIHSIFSFCKNRATSPLKYKYRVLLYAFTQKVAYWRLMKMLFDILLKKLIVKATGNVLQHTPIRSARHLQPKKCSQATRSSQGGSRPI